jgi:hypothetical protein
MSSQRGRSSWFSWQIGANSNAALYTQFGNPILSLRFSTPTNASSDVCIHNSMEIGTKTTVRTRDQELRGNKWPRSSPFVLLIFGDKLQGSCSMVHHVGNDSTCCIFDLKVEFHDSSLSCCWTKRAWQCVHALDGELLKE